MGGGYVHLEEGSYWDLSVVQHLLSKTTRLRMSEEGVECEAHESRPDLSIRGTDCLRIVQGN